METLVLVQEGRVVTWPTSCSLPANFIPRKFNQGIGFNLKIPETTLGI